MAAATESQEFDIPAKLMYERTIENLALLCKSEDAKGNQTLSEFCRKYKFDRPNLAQILNGHQEISVDLFMRVSAAVSAEARINKGLAPRPVIFRPMPAGVERWSLRTLLEMDMYSVHAAMYRVNFAAYSE